MRDFAKPVHFGFGELGVGENTAYRGVFGRKVLDFAPRFNGFFGTYVKPQNLCPRDDVAVFVHDVAQGVHNRYNGHFRAARFSERDAHSSVFCAFHAQNFADGGALAAAEGAGEKVVFFCQSASLIAHFFFGIIEVALLKIVNAGAGYYRHDISARIVAEAFFPQIFHDAGRRLQSVRRTARKHHRVDFLHGVAAF